MELNQLNAISPIDGRYHGSSKELSLYFSEEALMRYRVMVEIEYFIELCKIPLPQLAGVNPDLFKQLQNIYNSFSHTDALRIKEIEKNTNHDVKAVEYFIKEKADKLGLGNYKEFFHFSLTSQDINNTAIPFSLKEAGQQIYLPIIKAVCDKLLQLSKQWEKIPMLARTHGQPASPTLLGKEIYIFHQRIMAQLELMKHIPYSAKFGGSIGNFNAHHVAYPEIDWIVFADNFINRLGLKRTSYTTQIENYDNLAALFDAMKRINTILIDMCRDCWTYISMNYFTQKVVKDEVGSSTMPHKVNPIDFENAEGNLGLANSLLEYFAAKLPVSRLQRDLTDSTVLRNIGMPFAHSLIACKSLLRGLDKLTVNEPELQADLNDNWAVVAEAIQTILRKEGYPNPYELLKELTRTGKKIDQAVMQQFINSLDISAALKKNLLSITPANYTGIYKEF